MKQLYFFHSALDYVLYGNGYGHGFVFYDITSEDNNYFYFNTPHSCKRVCKITSNIECLNSYTGIYESDRHSIKPYRTKELWEKAKSDYFTKLLSDNEADRQKILKSMEDKQCPYSTK